MVFCQTEMFNGFLKTIQLDNGLLKSMKFTVEHSCGHNITNLDYALLK